MIGTLITHGSIVNQFEINVYCIFTLQLANVTQLVHKVDFVKQMAINVLVKITMLEPNVINALEDFITFHNVLVSWDQYRKVQLCRQGERDIQKYKETPSRNYVIQYMFLHTNHSVLTFPCLQRPIYTTICLRFLITTFLTYCK